MFSQATHLDASLGVETVSSHDRDIALSYRYLTSGFRREKIIKTTRSVVRVWTCHCKGYEFSNYFNRKLSLILLRGIYGTRPDGFLTESV